MAQNIAYGLENRPAVAEGVAMALDHNPAVTHIGAVHCETTTGLLNPIQDLGKVAAAYDKVFMVDAMSSFGAVPLSIADWGIHYLVSSSNKCIEGVPGFSFLLARRDLLEQIMRSTQSAGHARSLSLDLLAQWRGLEGDGQFRFTPPTHAILAFRQALAELGAEGGIAGRAARYHNYEILISGRLPTVASQTRPTWPPCTRSSSRFNSRCWRITPIPSLAQLRPLQNCAERGVKIGSTTG